MDSKTKEELALQKAYSNEIARLNLVEISTDLWKEGKKLLKDLITQELKPKTVVKGFYTCGICGLKNTVSFEVQDRSGDEGAAFYIYCNTPNCKGAKGWKQ